MFTSSEGGCFQRIMPPVDWDFGPVPVGCYDKQLTVAQIEELLLSSYQTPERVRKLANSDDDVEILKAKLSIEIVAGIDAETIWLFNRAGTV